MTYSKDQKVIQTKDQKKKKERKSIRLLNVHVETQETVEEYF